MKKRMTLMLLGMAVFVTAIGAVKYGQVKKAIAQHASFQPPPEAVTTIVTKREEWPASLDAILTLTREGQIVDLNSAAEQLYKTTRGAATDRPSTADSTEIAGVITASP